MPVRIHSYSLLCLFLSTIGTGVFAGTPRDGDPFLTFIRETVDAIPPAAERAYLVPADENLDDWTLALHLFRSGRLDSCRVVLARYNYTLTSMKDAVSGSTFDIFWEKKPITRGWGTLVYNRGNVKRLNIHVNHPVEDGNIPVIGAEMFRRTGAKWMLIGGSSRQAVPGRKSADMALEGRSVFQRWHELLTDQTQVSISLHAYNPVNYRIPISSSEVILSNGRTNDYQWGISQISLAFRDSLRKKGFRTTLAMLDSGFARLAGGSNPQGIHSNDNVGFGHWMNIELASRVRFDSREYLRFIGIADRAFGITHKSVAQQSNQRFRAGLPARRQDRRGEKAPLPAAATGEIQDRLLLPGPGEERYARPALRELARHQGEPRRRGPDRGVRYGRVDHTLRAWHHGDEARHRLSRKIRVGHQARRAPPAGHALAGGGGRGDARTDPGPPHPVAARFRVHRVPGVFARVDPVPLGRDPA